MASARYDVLILGGGNAGMGVTGPARAAGLKVAMAESWTLGGTCPNRGCTPKKVLVAAAHALHEIERAKVHCIDVHKPRLDWGALIARKKQMISHIPDALADTMYRRGVEVLREPATFVGPKAVRIGARSVEADHIVIATGSKPRPLPIAGAEHMITSDDILSDPRLPRELVFIGGGVIALEFGHVYARAGARVTILEALPTLLPALDCDAVEQVLAETRRIGIEVHTGVAVRRIDQAGERLRVSFTIDGAERTLEADRVVNGTGRVPNVDALDLAAGEVTHDRGRIAVDEYLRSVSNPHVHVCGDVLASPQLSPIATYEGRIVGKNIVEGPRHKPDYASIPSCIYTVPALASVGLTEPAAREKGHEIEVHVSNMMGWLSSRTYGETAAWSKVLVNADNGHILGAHILGHAAEELIHIFAFAMAHGITAGQIREQVYAFPTFSADIKSML